MHVVNREKAPQTLNARLFASPEDVYEMFSGYLDWLRDNPIKVTKMFGKFGESAELDRMNTPSIEGFGMYCKCTLQHFASIAARDSAFSEVFEFIHQSIYAVTYAGAAAGAIKEAIVIRRLGLADKVEVRRTERKVIEFQMPDNGRIEEADYELLE